MVNFNIVSINSTFLLNTLFLKSFYHLFILLTNSKQVWFCLKLYIFFKCTFWRVLNCNFAWNCCYMNFTCTSTTITCSKMNKYLLLGGARFWVLRHHVVQRFNADVDDATEFVLDHTGKTQIFKIYHSWARRVDRCLCVRLCECVCLNKRNGTKKGGKRGKEWEV